MQTKGFTLIELFVAVGILVFVLCGLLVLFNNCVFLNRTNRNLTIAMSHAQYVMEDIKNTPSDQIAANIDAGVWDWTEEEDEPGVGEGEITAAGLNPLTNEAIITTYVLASNPLQVSVVVTWDDPRPGLQTDLRSLFN